MNTNTYWNGNGKYQALYDELAKLIPLAGEIPNLDKNLALDKLRQAGNAYYDLYDNGLDNLAKEFRQVFGFGGKWIAKQNFPDYQPLEDKVSEIILNAAKEQGIEVK
jgi:hypothetical protein